MKNRIKEYREVMEIKQNVLCKKFNVEPATLSGWENNYDEIPLDKIVALSNIMGCSIDYLLYLNEENIKYEKLKNIDYDLISSNLKKLREKNKLTQKDMANICSIHEDTYRKYEKGVYKITGYKLYIICVKFNVSMDEILGRKLKKTK